MIQGREKHYSVSVVAKTLNVSRSTVMRLIEALGLEMHDARAPGAKQSFWRIPDSTVRRLDSHISGAEQSN